MKIATREYREPEKIVAAGFLRESKKQKGARVDISLDRQRVLIVTAIDRDGCELGPMFANRGASGRAMQKLTGLDEAYQAAKEGRFNRLYVENFDRLGRNSIEIEKQRRRFAKEHVRIFDAYGNELVEGTSQIIMIPAQHESVAEGERMSFAIRSKISSGRAYGKKIYGYVINSEDRYEIDEDEAPAIRLAYAMFSGSRVLAPILRALRASPFSPPNGKEWRYDHLYRHRPGGERRGILGRPEYGGTRVAGAFRHTWSDDGERIVTPHPDGPVEAPIPAIVSRQMDDAVKLGLDEIDSEKRNENAFTPADYLLQNVKCMKCGRPMTIGHGQNTDARPWGRTATLLCESFDRGECDNDRQTEIGGLQIAVTVALGRFMGRFPNVEAYQEAWRAAIDEAARQEAGVSASDIARQIAELDDKLGLLVARNAANPTLAGQNAIDEGNLERKVLRSALIDADRREATLPQTPNWSVASEGIRGFLSRMPRRIDEVEDPDERLGYETLRDVILDVRAISPRNMHYEFEVQTVLGAFKAAAGVVFKPPSPLYEGLLKAHEKVGKLGLNDEDQRRCMVELGSARNKVTRARDVLLDYEYIEQRGDRWYPTGLRPLDIEGKPVLVKIRFLGQNGEMRESSPWRRTMSATDSDLAVVSAAPTTRPVHRES